MFTAIVPVVCPPGDQEYVNGAEPPVIPDVKLPLHNPLQVTFEDAVIADVPPGVNPITTGLAITHPLASVAVTV